MNWGSIVMVSLPSHKVTINMICPQQRVTVSLKAYRSYSLQGHNFSFFNPILSQSFEYIMSHEIPPPVSTIERLKVVIMAIMSKGKHSFGIPHIFSLSWNQRIGLYGIIVEYLRSFFSMTINSMISIFTMFLDGLLAPKALHVMEAMYNHFTLGLSSSLSFLVYKANRPFLTSHSMASFSWM